MHVLTNWTARRSGGRMTITGIGPDGPTKISADQIDLYRPAGSDETWVIAANFREDDRNYRLAV